MMSKKILQINVTANWGSTGSIAEGIGLTAMKHGWESYIAYGRKNSYSNSKLLKVGNILDVYHHYAISKYLDKEGLGSNIPTKKLIKQIIDINPSIIHLHNIHDHWLNYPLLFNFLNTLENVPVVWTFHDCWAFTGKCEYFERSKCSYWKKDCNNCPLTRIKKQVKLNYNIKKNLFTYLKKRLTIISVSNWLDDLVKQSFLKENNLKIIHNGIDINQFKPTLEKRNFVIGVANKWNKRKGLDDFVKLRKTLDSNIGIVLVGLDRDQISMLPEGIMGLSKTENVKELVDLYSQAVALVNPTYEDNFPTVNIEALACGTPVITYKTGGSPEAVDEKTGIIVERGNIKELNDSILKIIKEPDLYSAGNCRKRAITNFNKDIQFEKYLNLYEDMLS